LISSGSETRTRICWRMMFGEDLSTDYTDYADKN
jgi:hypothetical protein